MLYLILTSPNYRETFFFLLPGVKVTLQIALSAYILAVIIGLFVGLARTSKNPFVYNLATFYVQVVRGIPLIVLILYTAFVGIPQGVNLIKALGQWGLSWAGDTFLSGLFQALANVSLRQVPMELRAIIALAIGYGAFEAEVFRAGIESIGKGQMEAALSLGMTYWQAMRLVILPQAIRRILPPLGNDLVAMIKDSALVTVLAVRDITQLARLRKAATFRPIETYNIVVFLYLSMTMSLSAVVRYIERKWRIV
ncbi:MAG: amino acid ABC transporter permease [Chloroflexi bacterium]|nr:amino acid ABC transporter permease [Chloroflexota bacterium]